MRKIIILLLTVFYTVSSFCQESIPQNSAKQRLVKGSMQRSMHPGLDFPDYPQLSMPEKCRDIELPAVVDNASQPYLRPVFSQQGASCGQAASVGYNFCYEINRLRNLPADTSINQYPDHFTWNFMNATLPYYGEGVSYFHTFDILYDAGNPTEDIYGPITMDDSYYWMNGYEGYFQAMHNRISGVNSIHAGTPEGLIILKNWLHNHLDGSTVGGVANFYAGFHGYVTIPAGIPEAGKHANIEFSPLASHALTIVGYNDSVRFDVNNDGLFTNDLDITDDGIVDMRDWETGALKYVNSYGDYWADSGFCYMLYRTLAIKYGQGGIWNNSVHVLHADTACKPLATIRATIQHNKRGRIRLMAGISSDTARYYPEHTLAFSVFNYQGLDYNMSGNPLPSGKSLEIGLDISPLLNYIKPGSPSRIFLLIDEKDPDGSGNGLLLNYSVVSYLNSGPVEFTSADTPLAFINNNRTVASVITEMAITPIEIAPEGPLFITSETAASVAFSATGGFPPYTWELKHIYTETDSSAAYPGPAGEILVPSDPANGYAAIPLPFSFPFYGELYDTLYMHVNGYLMFDRQDMPYYYLLFDEPYLREIKAIAGFMHKNLALNTLDDYISVSSAPEQTTFNWHISSYEGLDHATFSISVFPDGHITIHYGLSESGTGISPVIGTSNGKREDVYYSLQNGKETAIGKIISFNPAKLPPGILFSEDGLLNILPGTESFADDLIIRVTDVHRLKAEKRVLITTGPVINIRLTDTTDVIRPGAILPLSVEIINRGNHPISNMHVGLSPASSNTLVTGAAVLLAELQPGQTVSLNNIFELIIPDSVSSPQTALVLARASSGNVSFRKYSEFPVNLPVVVVSPPVIDDGDNMTADPGEEVPLVFNIFNYGNASAGNLTAVVTIDDPFAAINGSCSVETGELKGYSKKTLAYKLKVNQAAPHGREITINLSIRNDHQTVFVDNFTIILGPAAIVIADLDVNRNSGIHMAASLRNLNTAFDMVRSIDTGILNYDIILLTLGFFTQNHALTHYEDSLMVEFLDKGGKIYLEGGAFFKQDPITELRTRMRVTGSSLAWSKPADTLAGIAGTPAEGIQFDYQGDWMRGENLLAQEPALPWFRDKNSGLDFVVALDSGYYRTLASTVEFGGTIMFNSPGRPELMRRYLEFLGYQMSPLSVVFKPEATQICTGTTIGFEPLVSGQPQSFHWTFDGGTPATWEGLFPMIKYETPGIFSASLSVNDGITSNTFTLENLITVDNCNGIAGHAGRKFVVYPNPASDFIIIEVSSALSPVREILVSDLQGRTLQHSYASGNDREVIPTGWLSPGMYMVVVSGESWSGSSKLVIH